MSAYYVYPKFNRKGFAPILIIFAIIILIPITLLINKQFLGIRTPWEPKPFFINDGNVCPDGRVTKGPCPTPTPQPTPKLDQVEENYPCGVINNRFFKINCPGNWNLHYILLERNKGEPSHNSLELVSGNNSIEIDKPGFFDLATSDSKEKIKVQFMNQKVKSQKFNFVGEGADKGKVTTWIINGFIEPTNNGDTSDRLNFTLRCRTKCDEITKKEMLDILASFGGFKIE